MTYAKPFQTLRRIVEPGLAQQQVRKQTAAHADLAMNPPHRQRNAFLIQRRFPCEYMLIHAVDQSAVEIEQKRCLVACHARRLKGLASAAAASARGEKSRTPSRKRPT